MRLMTIGYEGLTIGQFKRLLSANSVEHLIDVRELPLSRKPGFSKAALAAAVTSAGIQYTHMPEMGCPRPIRHQYRQDGDWDLYTRRFLAYLTTQATTLQNLLTLAKSSRACLMCFEANPAECHRSYVAARVSTLSAGRLRVQHIGAIAVAQVDSQIPVTA